MMGRKLLVRSDVIVDEGCALTMNAEGTDHVRLAFRDDREPFELVVHHQVLDTMVQLGTQTLLDINASDTDDEEPSAGYSPSGDR